MANILFVEDEQDFARVYTALFNAAGHTVEIVGDGMTALKRTEEERFSLIVLDILLPAIDGLEVCRRLRARGDETPTLVLTALTDDYYAIQALNCAGDYMHKRGSTAELMLRVRKLLVRADEIEPKRTVYHFNDIEVDQYKREVRRNGKPLNITPLQFKVLLAFVQTPGKCWVRDDLIEHVWKEFKTDRVVDQIILSLRRKIGKGHVTTIKGNGYRFDSRVVEKRISSAQASIGPVDSLPGESSSKSRRQ